ncbi:MaoC family dehydratase N-terminal domain-containing protein [Nocardia sp. NPDC051900]|uniref:FAS1-like dehydratase domain-containing protein n=1 Tax=Nocardia sp. NPDC051900 TaxID=3364326 RepID=UPI0037A79C9F
MATPDSQSGLAIAMRHWRPAIVESARRVDPWQSAAFAALLDAPAPADELPPLWHWFTLIDHPPQAEIGEDGHPATGPFLPPIPGRRRMFAGGRFEQWAPIPHGCELSARAAVTDVNVKTGRTGEMAFVTVRHELAADGKPVAREEQDVVYRSEPAGTPPRTMTRPDGDEPEPEHKHKHKQTSVWRRSLATDPVLLARFSGLTYNGHRIHYDRPYATGVEGYPDLVVHGPLLALLALELPRLHGVRVRSVAYRLVQPAFVPATVVAAGSRDGDELSVTVAAQGVAPSLTASIRLA